MSDKSETLAAILAEMKRRADEANNGLNGVADVVQIDYMEVEDWVSRIEAAAELERIELREDEAKMLLREYAAAPDESLTPSALELKRELLRLAPAPGNAAAMREALEKILHEYGWGRIGCRTCVSSEADVERVSDLFEKQIDAALAAPARNCDIYTNGTEGGIAFRANRPNIDEDAFWPSLVNWLFAPAEGGDHA